MLSKLVDGCYCLIMHLVILINTAFNFNQHCFYNQATATSNITSAEELVGMDIHHSRFHHFLLEIICYRTVYKLVLNC